MNLFEVVIVKENYDEKIEKTIYRVLHQGRYFAFSENDAVNKAVIDSEISIDDIDEVSIYVNEFKRA